MLRFIEIAGLQDELQDDQKERTIFVPNDDAFRSLPWPIIEQMYNNNTFLRSMFVLSNEIDHHFFDLIINKFFFLFSFSIRKKNKDVLKSHFVNGIHYSLGLQNRQSTMLRSQNGEKLQFKTKKCK